MTRAHRSLIAAGLLAAATAYAQTPQTPTFRTGANYIRVDVYPTRNGAPIADLTQDDFEILDEKVPQKIEQFERVLIRGVSQQEAVDPGSVRDMRSQLETTRGRVFVIFLDIGHVTVGGSYRMRQPLTTALDRMIGPDDLVAIMTPEMSPNDLTFARKTTTIQGFLSRHWNWGEAGDEFHTPITDPIEKAYETCYGMIDDPRSVITKKMVARRREREAIAALRDLMLWLRGAREERKAVIVVSDGFEVLGPDPSLEPPAPPMASVGIDPRTGKLSPAGDQISGTLDRCSRDRKLFAELDDRPEFMHMLDAANAANASFYPINPAGLEVVFGAPVSRAGRIDGPMFRDGTEMLQVLASNTDGLAIVHSNDLAGGMKRIVDDLTSYYLLGYYSTGKLDGRFHAITVRVKRPGVQVRARRGYLAARPDEVPAAPPTAAPGPTPTAVSETRALDAALSLLTTFPRDAPLRLQPVAGWKPGGAAAIWIVGELSSSDDWRLGAEADVMLVDGHGSSIATAHATIPIGARTFRLTLSPTALAPGEYTVSARVRGAAGSSAANETLHVVVEAGPSSTGAVLVRRGPTTGNKDVATVDSRFRRSEQVRVEIPASSDAPVTARLLDRTGKALAIPVTAAVRDEADGSKWQTAQVALAPLAPGDYVIEISRAGGVGTTTRTLVAFRVVP